MSLITFQNLKRDTNSLWNIDQRAILYPADIQTDESSLMAQYV